METRSSLDRHPRERGGPVPSPLPHPSGHEQPLAPAWIKVEQLSGLVWTAILAGIAAVLLVFGVLIFKKLTLAAAASDLRRRHPAAAVAGARLAAPRLPPPLLPFRGEPGCTCASGVLWRSAARGAALAHPAHRRFARPLRAALRPRHPDPAHRRQPLRRGLPAGARVRRGARRPRLPAGRPRGGRRRCRLRPPRRGARAERRPCRGSPCVFALLHSLRTYLLPLLALLFFSRGDGYETWLAIFLLPSFGIALFHYLTFSYRFGGDELVIRSGFLFRQERHIPYARIHNVDLRQNPLHRLAKVAVVRLETGSGGEAEAEIAVLTEAAIAELKAAVFRLSGRPAAAGGSRAAREPGRAQRRRRPRRRPRRRRRWSS